MKRMIDWREGKQGLKTRLILALRHRAICPKQIRLSDECEECHQKSYRKGIIAKIAQIPFMSLASAVYIFVDSNLPQHMINHYDN